MFDIGFSEILVIAVVALIVIGPERLPGVARTLGHLFGRMQRYVNDVKADIQREMELDELKKLRKDVEDSARSIEEAARSIRDVRRQGGRTRPQDGAARAGNARESDAPERRSREPPAAALHRTQRCRRSPDRFARLRAAPAEKHRHDADCRQVGCLPVRDHVSSSEDTFISHLVELRDRLLRAIVSRAGRCSRCCSTGPRRHLRRCSPSRCCRRCRRAAR